MRGDKEESDHSGELIEEGVNTDSNRRLSSLVDREVLEKREREAEEELKWATIRRVPTNNRMRQKEGDHEEELQVVDIGQLGADERRMLIESLIGNIEHDNSRLLQKQKQRIDRYCAQLVCHFPSYQLQAPQLQYKLVHVKQPTIEVRYKNLSVEAEYEVVHGKPIPTLWNSFTSMISGVGRLLGLNRRKATVCILKDISGVIKPGRMTLLLGPPGCGKSTFLRALSGNLDKSLKVNGEISYNGYRLDEFVPEKTSAYISQHDLHIPEMTVREVLDFSARFQGVGCRADIMKEVLRKEKDRGITPDLDVDAYMKAISLEGLKRSLQTDYILKIMGLDMRADMIVGDAMRRGISGGEKRRLSVGEMLIGPSKALFMDEISTGLDSSTTYQVVCCLQQLAHIAESTVVVSLLQPAPETYHLFDDIILMSEGNIVYHGPTNRILSFFEDCGFKCPERKGTADFLQEVLSKKDQKQYWCRPNEPYSYITVDNLVESFRLHKDGQGLSDELKKPFDKMQCHKHALTFSTYSRPPWELFKACLDREWRLMRRNSFIYVLKLTQLGINALITGTILLRTRMGVDTLHSNYYMASLFFALFLQLVHGLPEVPITVTRLPIFYKQRDNLFYPAWAYSISALLLKIPISLLESIVWTTISYFLIGYTPQAGRYFRQLVLLFFVNMMSLSMFRCVASYFQTTVDSALGGTLAMLFSFLFGGFIVAPSAIPRWLKWGFWMSPLTYGEIGLAVNEFKAPRWQKIQPLNVTIGTQVLISRGLNYAEYYYWIGAASLIGFIILFNFGFTLALSFKKPYGASRAMTSSKKLTQIQGHGAADSSTTSSEEHIQSGKMVLPFIPVYITFQDLSYYVEIPKEMREQGYAGNKLRLLHNITGAFQPGTLSAIMGVTGAGKTTLLDVLSGRKTRGYVEGNIRINGYPKMQHTFARISGYCEQTDIHSPQITVEESIAYSAWLRLPEEISIKSRDDFVDEVIKTMELDPIRDALVGLPGLNGLSTEQRKRLTIAVELVSNPSVIFMDEPTSGLDARAAAIVMRTVKNVAQTGRTVVCTIHQPSIDIFESFDELILMKRGGKLIYSGPLGRHSSKVAEYFEAISGVPKIRDNYNPATWMMEVSSPLVEAELGINFAHIYKESNLHKDNIMVVKQLSMPPSDSSDLRFETRYPQNIWVQFKACLWKQSLSYWRSPQYNLVRTVYMFVSSVMFGILFWKHGDNIKNQQDLFNILGCMCSTTLFSGFFNSSSVMSFISIERTVFYREDFAGMYSPWAYSFAQVAIEIPYVLFQAVIFMIIAYPAIGFEWTAAKFMWFFYTIFCTLLYMTYLGMMLIAMTPTLQLATIVQSCFNQLNALFSGLFVPHPQIPTWWIWMSNIFPLPWTLNTLFTSQYGDVHTQISVFGEKKPLSRFLEDYFGFHRDRLWLVTIILALYPIVFATLFAFFIGRINYQKR